MKKADINAKILDNEWKYFTTPDYNKFTNVLLDVKIKNKKIFNESDVSRFINNSDLDKKIATLTTKAEKKSKVK